jgi:putative transposase
MAEHFTAVHLTPLDRIEMKGGVFRAYPAPDGDGYVFEEVGGAQTTDEMTDLEVFKFVQRRAMIVHRGYYAHQEIKKRRERSLDPDIIPKHIMYRARMLTKFLEEWEAGRRQKTVTSVREFIAEYQATYEALLPEPRAGQPKVIIETHHLGTPDNFIRLVRRFEKGGRSPFCLMYGGSPAQKAPRKRRLPEETNRFLDAEARKLANYKRPDIAAHWDAMVKDNADSPKPVFLPKESRTFYRRVAEQKRMRIDLGHLGEAATRDKYELSKTANRKYAPLDRIEMDEDKFDIIAMLKGTRLWNVIAEEIQEEIVKRRFWASIAIDCGTRSIMALRFLDSDPKGRSAIETLHMAVMPKDEYAKAAGTKAPWIQFGIPREVATDHGAAYLDNDFHECVVALCGSHIMPPAETPRLRGRIERFFKTGKKWLRLFSGQTFSNPIVRGGYDSVANASMDFEELAKCLVRLIVDAYHLTEHRGLGNGLKPIDAWSQMTRDKPVDALLDPAKEGMIFGFRVGTRAISRHGVVCLGIPYYHSTLQKIIEDSGHARVHVRANPYDLGAIGVRLQGDTRVFWVNAAVPGFEKVTATEWAAIKKRLDEAYSQHDIEDAKIVAQAKKDVMSIAKIAEDKHSVASHIVTSQDYENLEKKVIRGYVVSGRTRRDFSTTEADMQTFLIDGLDHSEDVFTIDRDDGDELHGGKPEGGATPDGTAGKATDPLVPSDGQYDPDRFARRRAQDGVAGPLQTPAPKKETKQRPKKEEPYRIPTVGDLMRGTPAEPKSETTGKRQAGRVPKFKAYGSDEEE